MRAVFPPLPPPSLLLFLALSLSPVLCDPTRQLRMKQPADSNLQGFTFRDDLLLDISAWSIIHCATVCANTDRCVTLTYTRGSSADVTSVPNGGDCRIHSARMNSSSVMINTANTEVYQNEDDCSPNPCENGGNCTDGINSYVCECTVGVVGSDCETVSPQTGWLQQACTVNADCPAVNWECFSGECMCTPGYLYSNSQLTCEASCSNLNDTFLAYPLHDFQGHDVGIVYGDTLQDCKDMCVAFATATCRTMVVVDGGGCRFQSKTALDEPSSWETSGNSVYQRTCD